MGRFVRVFFIALAVAMGLSIGWFVIKGASPVIERSSRDAARAIQRAVTPATTTPPAPAISCTIGSRHATNRETGQSVTLIAGQWIPCVMPDRTKP